MTQSAAKFSPAEFQSTLNDECAALRAFVVLLEDEQRSLLGQHVEELLQLSDAKIQLVNKVAALAEARRRSLPGNIQNMAEWVRQNAPQSLAIWQEARRLATTVQQLNQTNGELIQTRLRYNQQALSVLYGAAQNAAGLYSANGQTTLPTTSRTLGSV